MTTTAKANNDIKAIAIKTPTGEALQLQDLFTERVNILHFQNSFRCGQTCRVVMPIIEENLDTLRQDANIVVIVRDNPFDQYVETTVPQYMMSQEDLSKFGVLGEDSYIKRATIIVDRDGKELKRWQVAQEQLTSHFAEDVIPAIAALA